MVHCAELELPKTERCYKNTFFRFNFRLPFEVNNCTIRTYNVVLVSECRFVSKNVVFVSEVCVLVVEDSSDIGICSFTFGTPLNSGVSVSVKLRIITPYRSSRRTYVDAAYC